MPTQSDTSAVNASLELHFYMVEAYLIAARDAFAPSLELLPTAQELGTTPDGLPKQMDAPKPNSLDIMHVARCQVGNANLGYAYEFGFKLLIRLDGPAKETFKGSKGHDLTALYNKLPPPRQSALTEQDRVLGTDYLDYEIQAIPKGTEIPRAKQGRRQERRSLGERLRKLQKDKLLNNRYRYVDKPALPIHTMCSHWTWMLMEWTLTDLIRPALERRLAR